MFSELSGRGKVRLLGAYETGIEPSFDGKGDSYDDALAKRSMDSVKRSWSIAAGRGRALQPSSCQLSSG